jgi:hypothetical protein
MYGGEKKCVRLVVVKQQINQYSTNVNVARTVVAL